MLVVAALGLLAVAWVMADPPGAPPDEATNYIRALAAGRGEWVGEPPSPQAPPLPGPEAETRAWQQRTTRLFRVPGPLSPSPFDCLPVDAKVAAGCLSGPQAPISPAMQVLTSYVGTYQPLGFVAAGLATRGTHDAATALRRARLANVGLWLGLLAFAAVVLGHRDRPGLSLLGLVVAVTPMAVFLGASVSPNGLEIAAGVGLWAALLRLARPGPERPSERDAGPERPSERDAGPERPSERDAGPERPSERDAGPERPSERDAGPLAWAAVGVSGAVLAFTRSLGPAFTAVPVVVVVVLEGPGRAWRRVREGGKAAIGAAAAVTVATGASLVWEAVFQPHAAMRKAVVRQWLIPSVQELPSVFREHVGVFGPLAVPMNVGAYWLWSW